MKASVYNERNEEIKKFASVEKALKHMSDVMETSQNDPMAASYETEYMGIENGCAYFNIR